MRSAAATGCGCVQISIGWLRAVDTQGTLNKYMSEFRSNLAQAAILTQTEKHKI
jgi:hypothetical protein